MVRLRADATAILLPAMAAMLIVLLVSCDADGDSTVPAASPTLSAQPTDPPPTPDLQATAKAANDSATATVQARPTSTPAPTATSQPSPTAVPTATSLPSPTAVPSPAAIPTQVVPSTVAELFRLEPAIALHLQLPRKGADSVVYDGTHLWMRSHTPIHVLVQTNADGTKTGYEPEYGGGRDSFFAGPVLSGGSVWMLDVESDALIRVDGESESMTSIPIGPVDEPNIRDAPILFGAGSGVWVRNTTTSATAYDAEGNVLREVSWPFESERIVATDTFVFVEDDSNNEILQLSLDGTELKRIPLGFKPYLLHATDDRVYVRSNAGRLLVRGPTVFSIDVASEETIEYTTPDRPESKKAVALLETEDWMWVAYNDIQSSEYTGDVVRFSLDGEAQHRYIGPPGIMASSGDYVWVSDFIRGFSRIPSPQP